MGNKNNWWQKFTNATLKAAIADSPTVATASGWRIDDKGNAVQDQQENPGVKQLRDNIAILGGLTTGITAAPLISAPAITHALTVMGNPVLAKTTTGAVVATGLDTSGLIASYSGLKNVYNKTKNNTFTWKDSPELVLSVAGAMPGGSVLTRLPNWATAINTARTYGQMGKLMTTPQYFKALPGNLKSLIQTYTNPKQLQSIVDDTYKTIGNNVERITNRFGSTANDVGASVGLNGKILHSKDFGTVKADLSDSQVASFLGTKPISSKINYIFDELSSNVPQMAQTTGDGIFVNRAHFIFPFRDAQGNWQMLNAGQYTGTARSLVGHEAAHSGMYQISPIRNQPFLKLNSETGINPNNKMFQKGVFKELESKAGTHDGLPEEYLADYFGELAQRKLPQNTDWNTLSEDTQNSIIKAISSRRALSPESTKYLLGNLSNYGYIGSSTPGQVKYYGPTMGKTTAAKTNPNLVDFDDVVRDQSNQILKKYGFNSKYHMFESGNQEAIKEYQDMLVREMKKFKGNPTNSGKTLIVSQSPVVNPETTGFYFDNEPSIPSKDEFIKRNVGRGGTYNDSTDWYDNLLKRNPNLKIDNRFVSEIEKPKYSYFSSSNQPEPEYSLFTPKDDFRKLSNEELIKASRSTRKFEYSPEGNAKWLDSQGLEVPTNIDDLFYDRVQRLPRSRTNGERISVFDPEAMQLSINEGTRNEGYIDLVKLSDAFDEPSMGIGMYERYRKGADGVPFTAVSFDAASRLSRLLYGRNLVSGRHLLNPGSTIYNTDRYLYTAPVSFKGKPIRGKFDLYDPELAARYQLALNQPTIPATKEQLSQLIESNKLLIKSGSIQVKSLPEVYDSNGVLLDTDEAIQIAKIHGLPKTSAPGFYVRKILPGLKTNFDNRVAIRHPFWHPSEQGLFGYKQGGTIE